MCVGLPWHTRPVTLAVRHRQEASKPGEPGAAIAHNRAHGHPLHGLLIYNPIWVNSEFLARAATRKYTARAVAKARIDLDLAPRRNTAARRPQTEAPSA